MKTLWTPPVNRSVNSDRTGTPSRGLPTPSTTKPLRRFDAPSRLMTATSPAADTFTSFTVRASTCGSWSFSMRAGSVTSQTNAWPSAPHVPVIA